ncbi:hypothetical protein [Kutzneria buriramensis]|uniref:Uncharacterized protein n=1 Tax=Kutzneria buriramensis TaxID=1045776 RepID=A0A3E0I9N0_9PSEU|nr:hypothetical protein [Kutzneria buriramensis]REH55370.1 hypothetical protein BCF44_101390 [Kutzneria buriramensis]
MPSFVWALVLIGVVGLPTVTAALLYRRAPKVAVGAVVVMAAWGVVSALLAASGAYDQDASAVKPWLGIALVGVVAVLLAAARIPAVRQALAAPDTVARLVAPQVLRVVGVMFLLVMALGQLPAVFALPAGLGDMAVGIAAPFIARRLRNGSTRGAVWFNVMGIVDLVVAVSIGYLAATGPTQLIHVTPSTEAVTMLPLVLIPTVAVPLALALHVLSLLRLRSTRESHVAQGRQTGPSPDPVAR